MRIRSIKREFWRSQDISRLEIEDRLLFIGLWSFHFTSRLLVLTGVFAGVLALVLSGVLDHKLNIVVATILAATVGCVLEGSGVK